LWRKSKIIENLFFDILTYSYLLPLVLFLIFFKKIGLQRNIVIISLYAFLFFFLNFFYYPYIDNSKLFKKIYRLSYTISEYTFFTYMFWSEIREKKLKNFISALSILFLFFVIITYFFWPYKRLDSIPIAVSEILVLIYAFIYLYEQFNNVDGLAIGKNYFFWITIGILIYVSGSFFFYVLANIASEELLEEYWYISFFFDIIKNVLFALAIYIYATFNAKKSNQYPNLDFK